MFSKLFIAALMVASVSGKAVELDGSNFDAEVMDSGKAAFVKFLAPWWGHCKKMKPDWDKLGKDFASSKTVIVGDVDCTEDKNKALCSKYGVKGYPTIKYFTGATAATGDPYQGGRTYADLKKFADENLGPSCGADNLDLCTAEQKTELEGYLAMDKAALDSKVKEIEEAIAAAEDHAKTEGEKLRETFMKLNEDKDTKVAEISKPLRLLRAAAGAKK